MRTVGTSTASSPTMVRMRSTGSPTSHVTPQNAATTIAVAIALCPRHRASSATRTTRGMPASTVSGIGAMVLSVSAADHYDSPPMAFSVSDHITR